MLSKHNVWSLPFTIPLNFTQGQCLLTLGLKTQAGSWIFCPPLEKRHNAMYYGHFILKQVSNKKSNCPRTAYNLQTVKFTWLQFFFLLFFSSKLQCERGHCVIDIAFPLIRAFLSFFSPYLPAVVLNFTGREIWKRRRGWIRKYLPKLDNKLASNSLC